LRASAFVAVVGASGCGKSSLARAGLQRAAAREEQYDINLWQVITVVPGADPFRSLADAVRRRVDATGLQRHLVDSVKWADEQEARFRSGSDVCGRCCSACSEMRRSPPSY
jgi:energy-coupling factor transporter ATP-binding protein EcfA2